MSEQKLISPLLDGFVMGDPLSDHDGVRCCPAMKENSDDKYIVKIISVPANQRQLDALLLTGAYKDAAAATEYFKELADGVAKEAQLLSQLSKLEGFLPYDGWQIVPMENNNLGYEVYLVGPYRRSLEKYLRRNTMTHLGAVNLGIDLCAALSICRRAGFMYVDLKPTNIYLTGEREYRIGDLGFVKLNALKYTSLPSKYRSSYTPPELHDALATLNPTLDIYAVGMILYQIYNNGVLPFEGKAPNKELPAPANADYEMAEIIQKALTPNPRNRYQTPIEMGQALVSYMQRNTINDVPIVPPAAEIPAEEPPVDSETQAAVSAEFSASPVDSQSEGELDFLNEMVSDETAPDTETGSNLTDTEMTEEVNSMLAQADELMTPESIDLSAIPVPSEDDDDDDEDDDDDDEDDDDEDDDGDDDGDDDEDDDDLYAKPVKSSFNIAPMVHRNPPVRTDDDDDDDDEDDFFAESSPKKKGRGWIASIIILLVLGLLGGGGFYFYQNYYLLPIDKLDIYGVEDTITVMLTTDVDETLLSVVCTDTYGNTKSTPVVNGQAVFTDLSPDTSYKITVEAEGFHKPSDSCTGSYITNKQTNIVGFSAKTGTEDGSVILNFTVDGPETQDWVVEYTAEEEETKTASFTGHMVAINGLTVGKTYTFTLVPPPSSKLWIVGESTLEFVASKIVVAENLAIVSSANGVLTAQWDVPADSTVESWSVRCYSDDGYDETITVTEATAQFSNISREKAYTVEVVAAGMTQNARTFITANPTTISSIQVDDSEPDALTVTWEFEGTAPEGGWLLMYSMDSSETSEVIKTEETSAVITTPIPKAVYRLSIQTADGSTVFGGTYDYTCPDAPVFDTYAFNAEEVEASFCRRPEKEKWTYKDVEAESYTSSFSVGEDASMVVYSKEKFYSTKDPITVLLVIRDGEGNVIPELIRTQETIWFDMWTNRYWSLDLPIMPPDTGDYTLDIYFNNAFVLSKNFTVGVG